MTTIEVVQAQIREILRSMEADRLRLLDALTILPPSPAEIDVLLDVETADPETEMRTVIECVIRDSFDPAIADLRSVAGPPVSEPGPEPEEDKE